MVPHSCSATSTTEQAPDRNTAVSAAPGADRHAGPIVAPRRPTVRYMLGHPARWIALGFGSGLSPLAPGTVGTLWAWVSFLVLGQWLHDAGWMLLLGTSLVGGLWACARTARELGSADPAAIVWDEIIAFWTVLLFVADSGFWAQLGAFALFRYLDAVKPGPVGWADRLFAAQSTPAARAAGIVLDDLVAAGCTLVVLAAAVMVGEALWT